MDTLKETPPDPKVEAIVANISQLMAEAEQMLNDSTSHHAAARIDLLRARCDTVRSHFAATWASAGRAMAEGARQTDRTIRENPYQALGIALGAGLVVGALLGRRSD